MVLLGVAWREWEALCSLCSIDCEQRRRVDAFILMFDSVARRDE